MQCIWTAPVLQLVYAAVQGPWKCLCKVQVPAVDAGRGSATSGLPVSLHASHLLLVLH